MSLNSNRWSIFSTKSVLSTSLTAVFISSFEDVGDGISEEAGFLVLSSSLGFSSTSFHLKDAFSRPRPSSAGEVKSAGEERSLFLREETWGETSSSSRYTAIRLSATPV